MVANIIVIGCTVLMVGALIWVLVSEHKSPDDDSSTDSTDKKVDKN